MDPSAELPEKLRLMAIVSLPEHPRKNLAHIGALLEGGVGAIMLRDHDAEDGAFLKQARKLREITAKHQALLIINKRVNIAEVCGADGVHLGFRSLPWEQARSAIGPERLLGFSTHNLDEIDRAREAGADYVTYGPVFPTPSKAGLVECCGLDGLREACAHATIPVLALGGINPENAEALWQTGIAGLAAIRGLVDVDNPREVAAKMLGSGPKTERP
ncbi:MAG: thiamine phosphate synthase [Candidatus Sumerlaeia bacterium]